MLCGLPLSLSPGLAWFVVMPDAARFSRTVLHRKLWCRLSDPEGPSAL